MTLVWMTLHTLGSRGERHQRWTAFLSAELNMRIVSIVCKICSYVLNELFPDSFQRHQSVKVQPNWTDSLYFSKPFPIGISSWVPTSFFSRSEPLIYAHKWFRIMSNEFKKLHWHYLKEGALQIFWTGACPSQKCMAVKFTVNFWSLRSFMTKTIHLKTFRKGSVMFKAMGFACQPHSCLYSWSFYKAVPQPHCKSSWGWKGHKLEDWCIHFYRRYNKQVVSLKLRFW